ncbi:MAG: hypothetical protein R3324_01575 [Halobacteriales archaeon]|nr:hypothetical protein [Halobacteriales archaeon]
MAEVWADETGTVRVMAWERDWLNEAIVATDFFHLVPDDDLDPIYALAPFDTAVYQRVTVK